MQVQGKIKEIFETQEVSEKFKKRELVVETNDQYPQLLLIQFTQKRCGLLSLYNIGDEIKVDINLRGRSWTNPQGETKYFNTIEGWRIINANGDAEQVTEQVTEQDETQDEGDLPF